MVDDEDYEELIKYKWHAQPDDSRWYANRKVGKGRLDKTVSMHRIIMGDTTGVQYDHIDGNGLNNQKSNLRIATHRENMRNRKNNSIGSSRYKGVCWHKRVKKWQSRIGMDCKRICLGYYDSEEEAARAYDIKARELFKEFARLNFIEIEVLIK